MVTFLAIARYVTALLCIILATNIKISCIQPSINLLIARQGIFKMLNCDRNNRCCERPFEILFGLLMKVPDWHKREFRKVLPTIHHNFNKGRLLLLITLITRGSMGINCLNNPCLKSEIKAAVALCCACRHPAPISQTRAVESENHQ